MMVSNTKYWAGIAKSIVKVLVYIGRYAGQDATRISRWPLRRVVEYADELGAIIKAENGDG